MVFKAEKWKMHGFGLQNPPPPQRSMFGFRAGTHLLIAVWLVGMHTAEADDIQSSECMLRLSSNCHCTGSFSLDSAGREIQGRQTTSAKCTCKASADSDYFQNIITTFRNSLHRDGFAFHSNPSFFVCQELTNASGIGIEVEHYGLDLSRTKQGYKFLQSSLKQAHHVFTMKDFILRVSCCLAISNSASQRRDRDRSHVLTQVESLKLALDLIRFQTIIGKRECFLEMISFHTVGAKIGTVLVESLQRRISTRNKDYRTPPFLTGNTQLDEHLHGCTNILILRRILFDQGKSFIPENAPLAGTATINIQSLFFSSPCKKNWISVKIPGKSLNAKARMGMICSKPCSLTHAVSASSLTLDNIPVLHQEYDVVRRVGETYFSCICLPAFALFFALLAHTSMPGQLICFGSARFLRNLITVYQMRRKDICRVLQLSTGRLLRSMPFDNETREERYRHSGGVSNFNEILVVPMDRNFPSSLLDKTQHISLIVDTLIYAFWNVYNFIIEKMRLFIQARTHSTTSMHVSKDSSGPTKFRLASMIFFFLFHILLAMIVLQIVEGGERRQDVINGDVDCIAYDGRIFTLVCSMFDLEESSDFNMGDYITLEKAEIFEGNNNQIILNGPYNGLFRIGATPSSLKDAPTILHLHMIGGETHDMGGFIIQKEQNHFIVDSCSSTGEIKDRDSGGICGLACSGDILITRCSSSGDITGNYAGGIAGQRIGENGGSAGRKVHITQCHSTGDVSGLHTGGICGIFAGQRGHVVITHSYSTGRIGGSFGGGIVGGGAGVFGIVVIERCYSEGDIDGNSPSGGIAGNSAGRSGLLVITNSYSRGDITGRASIQGKPGGICGMAAGTFDGTVIITNVYASGVHVQSDAGGIIGSIADDAKEINITMSVHNGGPIVGENESPDSILTERKNSGDINDIIGQIYCFEKCWDSETIWQSVNEGFPILRSPPTPSPTPSVTASHTPTYTVSGTPTPTNTASLTPSFTSSRTSTVSMTFTRTSMATHTNTQSGTPSETATLSSTETHSPSPSGYRTVTPSETQTPTKSGSSTSYATLSPSQTSSIKSTATPSSTKTQRSTESTTIGYTTTVTASPSNVSPTNGSRLIISACGVLQAFDCVTINYEVAVDIVRNATLINTHTDTKWSNTSRITAQSVDGTVPVIEFTCAVELNGKNVNPTDCSDHSSAEKNGLPFYAEYEMLSNVSCIGRMKANTCRLFTLVINVHVKRNHSDSRIDSRMGTLQEGQISTAYTMTVSVASTKESLLSARQRIYFHGTTLEEINAPIDVSSHPSAFSKTIYRDHDTPSSSNISVQLAGRSDLRVSWILPPQLLQFMEAPKTMAIDSHLVPPSMAIRDQKLTIRTHLLPHGVSTGTIEIEFTTADELVATTFLDLNITVHQGDIRLRQSSIKIAQSSAEGPTSRGILLANEGDKKVFWTSRAFPTHDENGQASGIAWLSFPPKGSISSNDERSVPLEVSPQLVAGSGVFEAWILIETDSWAGDSQNLQEEFPEISVPFNIVDAHFWIHVRFIVSSIFVCQQFAPVTTMVPNEMHVLPLRVVNTEFSPITVQLRNFSIAVATNISAAGSTEGALAAKSPINVEEEVLNRVLRLTPWWTIAPSRLALQPGTSGGFRVQIGYFDSELVPQDLEFKFALEVSFGGAAKSPEGVVATDFVIAFAPGPASPQTSYMIGNETQGGIGDRLNFVVKLLDAFGHGPATALFESERFVPFQRKQLPLLTISSRRLDSSSMNAIVEVDILTGHGVVTEFLFGLDLHAAGEVEIDVKLGNESVTGFPLTILSETVQCDVKFEVPDSTGTVCLCKSGHYRTETGPCAPCPPGTFLPSASDVHTCSICPKGSFAEQGESTCHKCIGSGIECRNGIIRMKNGHWCEVCQQLQFPRATILEQIRRGNDELFHECIPPQSCVVNATAFTSICASGYATEGPICDTCESSFVKVESGECLQCKSGLQDLILTIVGMLISVLAIAVITVLSYRDVMSDVLKGPAGSISDQNHPSSETGGNNNDQQELSFHQRSIFVSHDEVVKETLVNPLYVHAPKAPKRIAKMQDGVLKSNLVSVRHIVLLLVDYFQIAFILHAMEISPFAFNNEWVNHVSTMVMFTPSQAATVKCTMDSSPFQTSLTTILSPIMVLACVMVMQVLTTLYQTEYKLPFLWKTLFSSFARSAVLVINLIHMSVTNATLEVFDVYPIKIDSRQRSSMDLTMETSSSQYKLLQGIAIASLILIVIGYPLVTIVYCLKLYSNAKTPKALESLSKMTGELNVNGLGFLWDSVVVLRKVALLLAASFVTDPMAQMIWASGVLMSSVLLLAVLMPYKKRIVNYLQYVMILTVFSTLSIGFMIQATLDETGDQSKVDFLSNIVLGLQLTFLVMVLTVQVSMAPKALKSTYRVLSHNLACGTCHKKNKVSDECSVAQVTLHDEEGNVLPSWTNRDNRLSLHHGDSISFASSGLQTKNLHMYRGDTTTTVATRKNQDNRLSVHHGDSISCASSGFQMDNFHMYKGFTKTTGAIRVKRTRKRP